MGICPNSLSPSTIQTTTTLAGIGGWRSNVAVQAPTPPSTGHGRAGSMELVKPCGTLPCSLQARVRVLRQRAGFTQRDLARCAGLNKRTIERLEASPCPNPPISTVVQIASALGVPLQVLVADAA